MVMTEKNETERSHATSSIMGGSFLVAGTTIGAGMLALPIAGAGMWSFWMLIAFIITWFCIFHSGLMILETNLNYPLGSSFDTIVKDTLGQSWNIINGITVSFVSYILVYAYISAGGSAIAEILNITTGYKANQMLVGLIFASVLAFIVWSSTKAVDRMTTILVGGMVIAFVISISSLTFNIKITYLLDTEAVEKIGYFPFIFSSLSVLLTAFGYHQTVPSLVKYYGKSPKKIMKSLLFGTLLALLFYIFWVLAVFGNIPRNIFVDIIRAGGNTGNLLASIDDGSKTSFISTTLSLFAVMAIASSFLGVTLGLFDYLMDLFHSDNTPVARVKIAAILYAPPFIGSILYPDGFLMAIGFAGLAMTVWAAIVPALMAKASRRKFGNPQFKTWGGNLFVYIIIIYGLVTAACHILAMLNLLPVFGQ